MSYNRHEVLFHRHSSNSILTAALWPYAISSVFNPGVTRMTVGTTILEKRTESYVKAKESQHPA